MILFATRVNFSGYLASPRPTCHRDRRNESATITVADSTNFITRGLLRLYTLNRIEYQLQIATLIKIGQDIATADKLATHIKLGHRRQASSICTDLPENPHCGNIRSPFIKSTTGTSSTNALIRSPISIVLYLVDCCGDYWFAWRQASTVYVFSDNA